MSQHKSDLAFAEAASDRVLTDGDVQAIAEATAARLAEMVSAGPTTFALVDARQLAEDLGVSLDYVRPRDRAGRDAPRLGTEGAHPLRSRPRAAGAGDAVRAVQRSAQEIGRIRTRGQRTALHMPPRGSSGDEPNVLGRPQDGHVMCATMRDEQRSRQRPVAVAPRTVRPSSMQGEIFRNMS